MPGQTKHTRIPFRHIERYRPVRLNHILYAVNCQIGEMLHRLEVFSDAGSQDVQGIAHADNSLRGEAVLLGLCSSSGLVAHQTDELFINGLDQTIQMAEMWRVVYLSLSVEDELGTLAFLTVGIGCVCHQHGEVEDTLIHSFFDLLRQIGSSQISAYGQVA